MSDKEVETIALARKHRGMSMLPTDGRSTAKQWQILMRKFSESSKEQCKSASLEMPRLPRSVKQFPTGSEYEGQWNVLGMSGFGTYTFPYEGVMYVGQFEDGMFHGNGELRYDCGAVVRGKWDKGKISERKLIFGDGLEYEETDWLYCKMPDRRFTVEYEDDVKPAGESYLTADQPTQEIPPGYYDVGDGFYDPETKMVYKYDDPTSIVRSPGLRESTWIVRNCRQAPDDPVGPTQSVYEKWMEPTLDLEFPPPPAARMTLLDDYDEDDEMGAASDIFFKDSAWGNQKRFSYNPANYIGDSRVSVTNKPGRKMSMVERRMSAIAGRASSFKTDASSTLVFKPGSGNVKAFIPAYSVAGPSSLREEMIQSTNTMKSSHIGFPADTQLVGSTQSRPSVHGNQRKSTESGRLSTLQPKKLKEGSVKYASDKDLLTPSKAKFPTDHHSAVGFAS